MKLNLSSLYFFAPLAVVSLLFTSCGMVKTPEPQKADRIMYQWYDTGGTGPVSVSIDLGEQIATIKRGDREIGWSFVAAGKEGRGTPAGTYYITEKIVDKYSNRYGWIENELGETIDNDASPGDYVPPGAVYKPAPMPYWMRLTDYGIGMHVGNIPQPGEPASHGCIRMPKEFVPTLYDKVKVGTRVRITY
ncbi:MAG: L,D-transpeptidase family protein [Akkermansiaceae bacterium]|jgi:lipoprotein-anchoring transpeptidase ErfK/SrfK|nr:L,D-transpeptidase family protein [Akkermansiaceae bacterium]MDP4646216.1 L,D-transpeptidase family protein [Akkermansiaceae bacterium]MDP4720848.1 L,D-transpeptidase family protein [Akkermansiaceae bacterium]MDP4780391.1 L,D-transpeptidase family protein [Akkermansiaceae bacterium]MDP4898026.1 L,D-transpeptidase family protein [Akkermansiaceae bacterium]